LAKDKNFNGTRMNTDKTYIKEFMRWTKR